LPIFHSAATASAGFLQYSSASTMNRFSNHYVKERLMCIPAFSSVLLDNLRQYLFWLMYHQEAFQSPYQLSNC